MAHNRHGDPTDRIDTFSSSAHSNSATADAPPQHTGTCPKCGCDSSWGAGSWCPECGYYPGVSEGISEVAAEPVDARAARKRDRILPTWVKVLLAGLFAVGAISLAAKYYFFYYSGNQGLWAIGQFLVGMTMACGAQFAATLVAMRANHQHSLLDGLSSPIEIWKPTFEKLPRGYRKVCCLAWGVMTVVLALVFIGGIDYQAFFGEPEPYRPKSNVVHDFMRQAKKAAKAGANGPADMEDGLNELVGDMKSADKMALPSPDKPLTCAIYGYMKDGRRDFGRLLLAARVQGEWKHVAVIQANSVPAPVRQQLAGRLSALRRNQPLVEGPFSGEWVNPSLSLEVSFEGWTGSQSMIDPLFERVAKSDEGDAEPDEAAGP